MVKSKKVLFTSHTANFSKFNRPFMRWLKEQGYGVHYASAGEEEVLDCDKHFTVPFSRSPFKSSNIRAYLQLKKIINAEQYDIIHTHTPMGSVVTRLAAKQARKQNKTRIVYTAHGFHFFKGAPLLNWLIYYPIEKWMARHTDTLVTINQEDYQRAKSKFNTDVQYIPGVGIDPKKFAINMTKQQKTKLRRSLQLKETDFVMIYLAELSKRKNQLWLINTLAETIKRTPTMHLLLAGQDSLNGKCQQLVKELGLEQNIHFLGYRRDIPQLLKISDIAVSPSLQEGLPMNVMEALSAGLPVVSTDIRGCTELIENDYNGYIYRLNEKKDLEAAVLRLFKDNTKRAELGKRAVKSAKQYDLSHIIKKMRDIYIPVSHEPIRILQVVTVMNRGGLETMIMNYYRNVDRSKVQFDFLVHRSEKGAYDDEIRKLGGNIYYHMPIGLKSLPKYKKTLATFFRNHPEFKVVHSHIDALSALPLSAAKKAGVPVRIAHSHNNTFDKDSRYLVRQVAKRLIKYYATDFFGCSSDAITSMFGKKLPNSKVINNAINTKDFAFSLPVRDKMRKALNLKDKFVLGHVGRFDPQKNHDFLIDTFNEIYAKNKMARLILIGDGGNRSTIEQKVKDLRLDEVVQFLGVRSDISALMQAMDIFIMPSYYEGFPVVSIEAQVSGLRCFFSKAITSDVRLTRACDFISLKKEPRYWATRILSTRSNATERSLLDNTKLKSFNITTEANSLQQFYRKRIER